MRRSAANLPIFQPKFANHYHLYIHIYISWFDLRCSEKVNNFFVLDRKSGKWNLLNEKSIAIESTASELLKMPKKV